MIVGAQSMSLPSRHSQPSQSASLGWWMRVGMASVLCGVYWAVGAGIFLLVGLPVGWVLGEGKSRRLGQHSLHWALAGFVGLLRGLGIVRVEHRGWEKWDAGAKGQILAPNHPALWDAILVMSHCAGLTCVLKSSLLRNPLLVGGAQMAQFIPGSPPREMVRRGMEALKRGQNLLLFPEGTRTRRPDCTVNELKGAVGIIARQTLAPVWPVVVQTDSLYLGKGWPVWRLPHGPVTVSLTLLEPLEASEHGSSHELVERLQATYESHLLALS
jgi:1-acyl-sn-glycerol-3-phosphate acyltransferase